MRNAQAVGKENGYDSTDSNGSPLRGHKYLEEAATPAKETTHLLDEMIKVATTKTKDDIVTLSGSTTSVKPGNERSGYAKSTLCYVFVVLGVAVACTVGDLFVRLHNNSDYPSPPDSHDGNVPFRFVSRASYSSDASISKMINVNLICDTEDETNNTFADLNSPSTTRNTRGPPQLPPAFVPFPTGAFWTNLVVRRQEKSTSITDELSDAIVVYPYALKWARNHIEVSYPSYRRIIQPLVVRDVFWPDVTINCIEGFSKRRVMDDFGPLSVTVRMYSNNIYNTNTTYMESYLVQGSPYITSYFHLTTPIIKALSQWENIKCVTKNTELCSIVQTPQRLDHCLIMKGTQFLITQDEGHQHWMLFVSSDDDNFPPVFKLSADRRSIIGMDDEQGKPFSGVVRLAILPSGSVPNATGLVLSELVKYSCIYPTKGHVHVDLGDTAVAALSGVRAQNNPTGSSVTFAYDTIETYSLSNNQDILMLALPHHYTSLKTSKRNLPRFEANYTCVKGNMIPVVGKSWTAYAEAHTRYMFENLESSSTSTILNTDAVSIIQQNIDIDKNLILPTAQDVYGFGKEIFRLAQLANVAYNVGSSQDTFDEIVDKLYKYLTNWLDERSDEGKGNNDNFVYDTDFGGIVTEKGLKSAGGDFGNGWYNDHHFHYGYYIYAATILSRFNATFYDAYCSHIDSLIIDITNGPKDTTSLSKLFPLSRHKSWYDGHSWASGLFPQSNGKNQESSSEAINAYYAVYLWHDMVLSLQQPSTVNKMGRGIIAKKNYSRLLLGMEIQATQMYWHTGPKSKIFPINIAVNYMIGNLGMLDATCNTWFGNKMLYVHLINVMPITDITQVLFTKEYVKGEYRVLQGYAAGSPMVWRGYLAALRAIINPEAAWKDAQKLESYKIDTALSKSHVLHWIATRPGLGTEWKITKPDEHSLDPGCASHPVCVELGLTGMCCPTQDGVSLGCC